MPRSNAASTRTSGSSCSPHQSDPSAHVPKPMAEVSRSVVPKVRRSMGRSLGRLCSAALTGAADSGSLLSRVMATVGWSGLLIPFIPLAVVLDVVHAPATAIFFTSALGVIPTAALMGRATEELAARSGPGIGGLLNVTFGNAPELIIALFALGSGLHEVVKASIIGSLLGNILVVLGGAMFVGGIGRDRQRSNATAANVQSLMLFLAAAALVMPAVFELVEGSGLPSVTAERVDYGSTVEHLSLAVALVLIGTYVAGLVFSLKTHRDLFNPVAGTDDDPDPIEHGDA